jgi:predicted nucleotidyltransferase
MHISEPQHDSPVDHRRAEIENRLTAIERDHQVHILLACESGSRAWGFASPDSDFDVRFLYVHPLPWYLRVHAGRDVIECPITDDLDINGWELRKALRLLANGNATLHEWLNSPIRYRSDPAFLDEFQAMAIACHQPQRAFYHYIHMARGNYREFLLRDQVRLKKYLYVLRPLMATLWIERGLGPVPMRFLTLVETLIDDQDLRTAIDQLLAIKVATGETQHGQPVPLINCFIERELTRLEAVTPPPATTIDVARLDRLLFTTVRSGSPLALADYGLL